MKKIIYSWILPIKDEQQALPLLIKEIRQAMRGKSYEIIAVDDASKEPIPSPSGESWLRKLSLPPPRWFKAFKLISFSSHQGKWAALREGIKAAKGEIIITSDSDLQDDPQEVKKLLKKLSQGYDLVSGWRKIRHDPYYKILISRIGNSLVSALYKKKFQDLNAPFKIYRRELIEAVPKDGSLLRFSMLFAGKMGYKTAEVAINHRSRIYGKSKFGVVKYLRIIYDLILVLLLFSGSGRFTSILKANQMK